MKLYTTPPSILTLMTWVRQSSGLWPSRFLQCAALLAAIGYDWPCGPIKGFFSSSIESGLLLDSMALSHSSELSYVAFFVAKS